MELRVHELQKDDEFVICSNGKFRYYKVLDAPRINPKRKYGQYSAVKCSTNVDIRTVPHAYADLAGSYYFGKTVTTKVYKAVPYDHNHIESLNLNWRNVWLVKRNTVN